MSVLLLMVVIATSKQYIGSPVECFCPSEFTESQVLFTNSFCWVSTTFYLSSNQPVVPHSFDLTPRVSFYHWLPLLFLLQSFLCLLPAMAWSASLDRCGLNLPLLFEISTAINKTPKREEKEASVSQFVELFDRYTSTHRNSSSSCYSRNMKTVSRHCFLLGGKPFGNHLCNCYLVYKLLCIGVCVLQMVLTDCYLGGRHFYTYGLDVLHGMIERVPWTAPHHFPSVTLCEMDVRRQARIHTYVVQCVLTINVFYEKIFVLLWFWWVLVAVVTTVDVVKWLLGVVFWRTSVAFVSKRLLFDKRMYKGMMAGFVKSYLRRDGVLVMRLLSRNHGDVLTGLLLERLWACYMTGDKTKTPKRRKLTVTVDAVSSSNSSTRLV